VHYWGHRDYSAALREFDIARQSLPNDARVAAAFAFVTRRQGNPQAAITEFRRAELLDPRNATWPVQLGNSFELARQYDDAVTAFDRALAIQPDNYQSLVQKAWVLAVAGQPARARAAWATIPARTDPKGETSAVGFEIAWLLRQPDSALAILTRGPNVVYEPQSPGPIPAALLVGQAWAEKGDTIRARGAFDAARRTLEAQVRADTTDADGWSWLGLSYAGLGRTPEAISAGRRATVLLPTSRDAVEGSGVLMRLATIYVRSGDAKDAVAILRKLLASSTAGFVCSAQLLRIDPAWDRIRTDPDFKAFLADARTPSDAAP
jgi:tetratricopeptide (TPR) repeat protein